MGSVHFRFCVALASLSVLLSTAAAQPTNSGSHGNGSNGQNQSDTSDRRYYSNSDNHVVNAGRQPLRQSDGHPVETYGGHNPHGSSDAPEIAAGAAAAGGIITALIIHEEHTPEHLGKEGPQVPKQFDMSGFAIKGLVGPNWPVVLDFIVDSPGAAQVDIVTGDKHHFRATMTNRANYRAYGIFRLPPDFGKGVQTAVYQVHAVSSTPNAAPPQLRTFGLGAGERAVGSVAIDQLTFQPPMIHPKVKEVANYGFHAHSAFDGVRAEFVYTTLYNGHVLVEKDHEEKLPPIPEGERGRGTWDGKGKAGQHMLQVRAWRGLENGGDWVVAWSPDIVDVVE